MPVNNLWKMMSFRFSALGSALVFLGGFLMAFPSPGGTVSNLTDEVEVRLTDYVQRVLQHNQTLQGQMLDSESSRLKWKAERGIFEPQLTLSAMREANRRTNNIQQAASLNDQPLFSERNDVYDGGVESLLPSGGKVRLGYTLSDLDNNVSPYGSFVSTTNLYYRQYQTFVGATFTQPLLRNAGLGITLASLRLAAADSEIGFQQYRRQLMLTVVRAEDAYWNLYFAQAQLHFFDDSVAVAQNVLDDSRQKVQAGQGSELAVMEAQSGLALRQTKLNEARQGYYDAVGKMESLAGTAPPPVLEGTPAPAIRVVDAPLDTNATVISYAEGYDAFVSSNPDYLIQKQKVTQEELRLGVAKNQMLPELDFKAAYGYNGLGSTPDTSWAAAETRNTPSWSAGFELTIPLLGNIRGRDLEGAAKLSLQSAYQNLCAAQTELANQLNSAIQKTRSWQQSIESYQTVVHYNEELLKTDILRLKAGTVSGHDVLEVEASLLDSQQNLASALVQYRQSQMQVELVSGSILKQRNLEVTHEELKRQSEQAMRKERASVN